MGWGTGEGRLRGGNRIRYLLTRGRNSHRLFKTRLAGKGNWKRKSKVSRREQVHTTAAAEA